MKKNILWTVVYGSASISMMMAPAILPTSQVMAAQIPHPDSSENHMDRAKIRAGLIDLSQVYVDTTHAYRQAAEKIDNRKISEQLASFANEKEKQVEGINQLIRKEGGTPPDFSRDFKGFMIASYTAIRGITGTEGVLKAMESNLRLALGYYDAVLFLNLPKDVRKLVQEYYAVDKRHLYEVQNHITVRSWENS
jgi:uncharacterized protein (TIGR02284 family)